MDDRAFAEQLCTWVDPQAVLKAADTLMTTPEMLAAVRFEFLIPSAAPVNPEAIGLDRLVRKFLRGFHLPEEYLQLLSSWNRTTFASSLGLAGARALEGEVQFSNFAPSCLPPRPS